MNKHNCQKAKVSGDVAMELIQCPGATIRVIDADGVEYFLTGMTLEETTALGGRQRTWTLKMESVQEQREAAIRKMAQGQWARERAEKEARSQEEADQPAWLKEANRLANLAIDSAIERQEAQLANIEVSNAIDERNS